MKKCWFCDSILLQIYMNFFYLLHLNVYSFRFYLANLGVGIKKWMSTKHFKVLLSMHFDVLQWQGRR